MIQEDSQQVVAHSLGPRRMLLLWHDLRSTKPMAIAMMNFKTLGYGVEGTLL